MSIKKHLKITKEALEKYGYNGLGRLSFASLEETFKRAIGGFVAVSFLAGVTIGVLVCGILSLMGA